VRLVTKSSLSREVLLCLLEVSRASLAKFVVLFPGAVHCRSFWEPKLGVFVFKRSYLLDFSRFKKQTPIKTYILCSGGSQRKDRDSPSSKKEEKVLFVEIESVCDPWILDLCVEIIGD